MLFPVALTILPPGTLCRRLYLQVVGRASYVRIWTWLLWYCSILHRPKGRLDGHWILQESKVVHGVWFSLPDTLITFVPLSYDGVMMIQLQNFGVFCLDYSNIFLWSSSSNHQVVVWCHPMSTCYCFPSHACDHKLLTVSSDISQTRCNVLDLILSSQRLPSGGPIRSAF